MPLRYVWVAKPIIYKSFSDLSRFVVKQPGIVRRFLPGSYIVEFKGRRKRELMESPEGMAIRLAPELQSTGTS